MRKTPHASPIATLPPVDKFPFSQKNGHAGREGTPHRPLLPDRLVKKKRDEIGNRREMHPSQVLGKLNPRKSKTMCQDTKLTWINKFDYCEKNENIIGIWD